MFPELSETLAAADFNGTHCSDLDRASARAPPRRYRRSVRLVLARNSSSESDKKIEIIPRVESADDSSKKKLKVFLLKRTLKEFIRQSVFKVFTWVVR